MRLKYGIGIVMLIALLTGCAGAADSSAAQQAYTELCEQLATTAPYRVGLETDDTLSGVKEINVTAPLIGQVAEKLKEAKVAEIETEGPGMYERHVNITMDNGSGWADIDLFQCGPDHPEQPDKTIIWVQQGAETSLFAADNTMFNELYPMLEAATYTPEVPVSEFVKPIREVVDKYRDGALPGEGNNLFQPLPEGSVLPETVTMDGFAVQEGGMFGYQAIVPMEGEWNMVAGLAFFDNGGWEVASVSFERKSDSEQQ